VPVTFSAPSAATTSYTVPLPALAAGAYEVHWNATGDGHAMEGTLHFIVQ
jgi:methionine-rich copper-binding protein CopC